MKRLVMLSFVVVMIFGCVKQKKQEEKIRNVESIKGTSYWNFNRIKP